MNQLPNDIWNKIQLYVSHPCADIMRPHIQFLAKRIHRDFLILRSTNDRLKEEFGTLQGEFIAKSLLEKIRDIQAHDTLFIRMLTKKNSKL